MFKKKNKKSAFNEQVESSSISQPFDLKRGISVRYDPQTGKFTGLPEEWQKLGLIPQSMIGTDTDIANAAHNLDDTGGNDRPLIKLSSQSIDKQIDFHTGNIAPSFLATNATLDSLYHIDQMDTLTDAVKPTLPSKKLLRSLQTQNIFISRPTGFTHKNHVTVDPTNATRYIGLPKEWESKLEAVGLDIQQIGQNKDDLDALCAIMDNFYDDKIPVKSDDQDFMIQAFDGTDKYAVPKFHSLPTADTYNDILDKLHDNFTEINTIADVYSNPQEVGHGSSGHVYRATEIKTGNVVAIKSVSAINFLADDGKKVRDIKSAEAATLMALKNEVALMYLSKECDYIVKLHKVYFSKAAREFYMIMDYCNANCLTNILSRHGYIKNERVSCMIIRDILKALNHLHENHRIYRDLKSDNVLLNAELINSLAQDGAIAKKKKFSLKLSDFGFAVQLNTKQPTRKSVVGTPFWMAPELIRGAEYNTKVDCWSLGIVVLELCESLPPHMEMQPLKAVFKIVTSPAPVFKKPSQWTPELNDFLSRCLDKDPNSRWSCAQLLEHPWIKSVDNAPLDLSDYF
ncbi:Kinase/ STE STE20 /Serine/threonine-protein kinase [Giardia duodenalis assemblage B]|uniref:non-specific serine/threonine protein kinase n=1 Tax=Giardia duodenalis assemblage B TaxID=1394984 RepID=A0A132NU75_GIAIN|nr:Kinase/ STE STE20 /Serine/threonine-protein kinase [Giardia intestinalis assemblage B]